MRLDERPRSTRRSTNGSVETADELEVAERDRDLAVLVLAEPSIGGEREQQVLPPEIQHLAVHRPQPRVELADPRAVFDLAQTPELQRGERIQAQADLDLAPAVAAQVAVLRDRDDEFVLLEPPARRPNCPHSGCGGR